MIRSANGLISRPLVGALPADVELPPVVGAAQPALLVPPVEQRRAPVRATLPDQADRPARVAEGDQVLAQQPDPARRPVGLADLRRQAGRDPVAAQQVPHRRPRADPGEDLVVFGRQHGAPPRLRSWRIDFHRVPRIGRSQCDRSGESGARSCGVGQCANDFRLAWTSGGSCVCGWCSRTRRCSRKSSSSRLARSWRTRCARRCASPPCRSGSRGTCRPAPASRASAAAPTRRRPSTCRRRRAA